MRKKAHLYFDAIWQNRLMPRSGAYMWLALQMNIPFRHCHIRNFNAEECMRVIEISRKFYNKRKVEGIVNEKI
jgi:hypothetical protein